MHSLLLYTLLACCCLVDDIKITTLSEQGTGLDFKST